MRRKNNASIVFLPAQLTVPVASEESVLEVALRNDVLIQHSCGGMGSCTTCRVFVEQSPTPLPPRNDLEEDIASMRTFADNERLSCQLPPADGMIIRIPQVLDESDFD